MSVKTNNATSQKLFDNFVKFESKIRLLFVYTLLRVFTVPCSRENGVLKYKVSEMVNYVHNMRENLVIILRSNCGHIIQSLTHRFEV